MTSESEYCDDYRKQQPETYEREVPVGNILLRNTDSVPDAAAGPLAGLADLLHTPAESRRERLVECKISPSFRGLGQLFLYDYLRRRDRQLVHNLSHDITRYETHIERGEEYENNYPIKPAITEIEKMLVTANVSSADDLLLSAYSDFGIGIQYHASGTWRALDRDMFQTTSPQESKQTLTTEWLQANSREALDSAAEEKLWENASGLIGGDNSFREVPIGSTLYPDRSTSLRADVVVQSGDYWFIVEIKKSTHDNARQAFQKAFGQASGYASIFSREWNISADRVAPVVIQDPLARIGGVYREDRYDDDYDAMRKAAFRDSSQPIIIGPSQKFE